MRNIFLLFFGVVLLFLLVNCKSKGFLSENKETKDTNLLKNDCPLAAYNWNVIDTSSFRTIQDGNVSVGIADSLATTYFSDEEFNFIYKTYDDKESYIRIDDYPKLYIIFDDSLNNFSSLKVYDFEKCIYKELNSWKNNYKLFYCDYKVKDNCYSKLKNYENLFEYRYIPINMTKYKKNELDLPMGPSIWKVIPVSRRHKVEHEKDTTSYYMIPIENYLKKNN